MSAAFDWRAVYRNYDDAALVALASAGLLRRGAKDVEAGKVGWAADGGEALGAVNADGQHVRLAPQGPGAARCDCPAPGICKHVLAAALWLRTPAPPAPPAADDVDDGVAADAPAAMPADAPAGVTADAAVDVLAEVLALDPAALFKAAGPAARRKAAGLFAALENVDIAVQGAVLVVALPDLDLVCRYVAGAGVDGMVSDAPPRRRKMLHLLALAAVRRAHGRPLDWPDADGAGDGEDADAADAGGLTPDERRFLAQAQALVHALCAGGWSHVGGIAAPQLRALATSARIEAFPRLAGLLRGLSGTADLLARRDFGADERQALRLAAEIEALVRAIDAAGAPGPDTAALLARLRGADRRSFAAGEALHLLALGAHWWEQRSGARGLTVAFWDADAGRVRSAVLARRDGGDPGFTRTGAWTTHALWQGAGAAASLAGSALALDAPRLAEDGRLGVGGATRAAVLPGWSLQDERWQRAGFDDWAALRSAIAAGAGLLGDRLDLVLLRPAACEAPRLDEVRQALHWRVYDRHGRAIVLRLPYEAWKAGRLDNLEAWTASGAPVAGIVARLEHDADGGLLEPVTLLLARDGRPLPVSLDFDAVPARQDAVRPGLGERLARMLKARTASGPSAMPAAPVPASRRVLDGLLAQLERRAMSGHFGPGAGDANGDDALRALHGQLLGLGLDTPAALLARYLAAPGVGAALALYRVAQACLELDTGFLDGPA